MYNNQNISIHWYVHTHIYIYIYVIYFVLLKNDCYSEIIEMMVYKYARDWLFFFSFIKYRYIISFLSYFFLYTLIMYTWIIDTSSIEPYIYIINRISPPYFYVYNYFFFLSLSLFPSLPLKLNLLLSFFFPRVFKQRSSFLTFSFISHIYAFFFST